MKELIEDIRVYLEIKYDDIDSNQYMTRSAKFYAKYEIERMFQYVKRAIKFHEFGIDIIGEVGAEMYEDSKRDMRHREGADVYV